MVYRRTARTEATRATSQASILKAASRLFAERGYDATTMQDIVRAAGTSIGNAYFYFENKEALFRALVDSSSNAMFDDAERHTARLTGPERVGTIIAFNTMNFLTTHGTLLRMLTADARLGVVQALGDLAVERWVPVLAGALPDRDATELPAIGAAIWGGNRSIVERIARGTLDLSPRAAVAFMVRWTTRALGVSAARTERIVASSWRLVSRHVPTSGSRS